ncbi:MAG: L,D-transpeptidase family protein [Sulfurimonas sp.]
MHQNLKILLLVSILLLWISGCNKDPVAYGKVDKTPYATKECRQALASGVEIDESLLGDKIIVYKEKHILHLYRKGKLVEKFRISLGKNGTKGDKISKGDYRTPIGSYTIVRKKCDNRLYRSLMISYPNKKDIIEAKQRGVDPGGYITIHGQPKWNADGRGDKYTLAYDWTEGCIAVTNRAMDILWKSIKNGAKIEIYA